MMASITAFGWDRVALLLAIFVVVVLLVVVASGAISRRLAVQRRVAETMLEDSFGGSATLRSEVTKNIWTSLIDKIEQGGLSLADTREDSLRAKMIAAGYTSPYASRWYTLIRIVTTLSFPALVLTLALLSQNPPSIIKLYFMGAISALFGLYIPNVWVSARADRRRHQITNGFPDALDLLLVCIEAGLGMEAAFDRVGREMALSHPLISEMLATIVLEMRAGRSREEALRRMADRAQVDEIKAFVTLLIQSDKLGSSIGTTLRIYSAEMRERRRMRAEEKAHRLPVLLSIPLVACMLPVMIGVLMLPAAIRVIRQLIPAMGGN
ncbi:type II secretion system F family protein [Aquisediminimonas sediminicola]|uniref:type II secretion system F family protein n=1 Tax=Alteraquisediminimonas sediminicola TaxID=2676787 RepID=UPI001C8D42C1|nr:type II secretion system F family protein [Aquisediminimonas sediminicola]